jgi:hypothetical protein
MTPSAAAALTSSLNGCLGQVELEQSFREERIEIEKRSCDEKLKVVEDAGKAREALIQKALKAEQERSKQVAAEKAEAEVAQWAWAAGGIGVGILVGAVATVSVIVYATTLN